MLVHTYMCDKSLCDRQITKGVYAKILRPKGVCMYVLCNIQFDPFCCNDDLKVDLDMHFYWDLYAGVGISLELTNGFSFCSLV